MTEEVQQPLAEVDSAPAQEVTLNAIVCLVKVNRIYRDFCTLQLLQRVVGGEDKFVTRSVLGKPVNVAMEPMPMRKYKTPRLSGCGEFF